MFIERQYLQMSPRSRGAKCVHSSIIATRIWYLRVDKLKEPLNKSDRG